MTLDEEAAKRLASAAERLQCELARMLQTEASRWVSQSEALGAIQLTLCLHWSDRGLGGEACRPPGRALAEAPPRPDSDRTVPRRPPSEATAPTWFWHDGETMGDSEQISSSSSRSLGQAFADFEASLKTELEREARRSVDGALERISADSGPFVIDEIQFDVVIRNVAVRSTSSTTHVAPGTRRPATKRRARPKSKPAATSGARGRPPGAVRVALLELFQTHEGDLDTDAIGSWLRERGVKTSTGNLHQQLRRLVGTGGVERVGRGRYRRPASST